MDELAPDIERVATESRFSGVIRVDRGGETTYEAAFGHANRAAGVLNTSDTRLAMASGCKAFTALMVVSLIEDGVLGMDTTARSILGSDLPLIADEVTVEQLLAHRSGIGDYLDEDSDWEPTDYVLGAVHEFDSTEAFLKVLDGYPMKATPGERFSYCNGGYMVLALIAERAAATSFHELVRARVTEPAGMNDTEYLRSDELPPGTALGYFEPEGFRTNVFHLPVRGNGDGGAYTTVGDMATFWASLFSGKIVPLPRVQAMVEPISKSAQGADSYGMGFWIHETSDIVRLEGFDAGVSLWTAHDPGGAFTCTVISNTQDGAWPIARILSTGLLGTKPG